MKNLLFIGYLVLFFSICTNLYPQKIIKDYRQESIERTEFHVLSQSNLFPSYDPGKWSELNPNIPRVDYTAIYFMNKDSGWCIGASGAIIKTTNGGAKWINKSNPLYGNLYAIHSYDGKIVIAVGKNGIILRSSDSGDSWTKVSGNVTGDLWSVQMKSETEGWICGLRYSLLKTTDGGLSWNSVSTGKRYDFWALKFINDIGYITCANGLILKTTDNGLSWQEKITGTSMPLYCIYAFDSLQILAGGFEGTLIKSSDGGATFSSDHLYLGNNIYSITFGSPNLGYTAEMIGTLFHRTTNGGITWETVNNMGVGEYSTYLVNDSIGYNCGVEVIINKTTDRGYTWNGQIFTEKINDFFFKDKLHGLMAAHSLYFTTDGGLNWEKAPTVPYCNKLFLLDSLNFFNGYVDIYKSTDGGKNWAVCNMHNLTDSSGTIEKFFFNNSNLGWAVTSRGGVFKTTNGGTDWYKNYQAQIYNCFTGIFFIDSLRGWITGSNMLTLKTSNGGNTWIKDDSLSASGFTVDVYFKDSLNGWVTGESSLFSTTNGGIEWNIVPGISAFNGQFQWVNKTIGYIYGGSLYKTTNGGTDWILDSGPLGLKCFNSPEPGYGFGGGEYGLILAYVDADLTPVELNSFISAVNGAKVILNWSTLTEKNNYGFEIERKDAGKEYKPVGFVKGSGTASEICKYTFTDTNLDPGIYKYRLKQIDENGEYKYYYLEDEVNIALPEVYSLSQNYPNPFNPITTIKCCIPMEGKYELKVYNVLGEVIAVLNKGMLNKGEHRFTFNAANLPSGIYIYTLTGNNVNISRKMILLK